MKRPESRQNPPFLVMGAALVLLYSGTLLPSSRSHSSSQTPLGGSGTESAVGGLATNQISTTADPSPLPSSVPNTADSNTPPALSDRTATATSSADGISFDLLPPPVPVEPPAPPNVFNRAFNRFFRPRQAPTESYDLDALFTGGSDSLVAKAVGGAEGTRTPEGGYTSAYRGHTDPGNGVWNLGTFSYQHGASSPEEADQKQLNRLRGQVSDIQHRAEKQNLNLSLIEVLNGIDLANQSPLAALGEPGYAEWLAEAYRRGLRGDDAILWARVKGYWDVKRGRWNAPGLGNTEPLIRRDQYRRMQAIARAVEANVGPGGFTVSPDNATPTVSSPSPPSQPSMAQPSTPAISPPTVPHEPQESRDPATAPDIEPSNSTPAADDDWLLDF